MLPFGSDRVAERWLPNPCVQYLKDVYQRKTGSESFGEVKLEFPRKFDIAPIYRYLGELALANRHRINA